MKDSDEPWSLKKSVSWTGYGFSMIPAVLIADITVDRMR